MRLVRLILISIGLLLLAGCEGEVWNSPYPKNQQVSNTLYSAFAEQPKHLDPVRAYSSDEYGIIAQIYEPIIQYHYLKRPYELIPATAVAMPSVTYYDAAGQALPNNAPVDSIVLSEYLVTLKPEIYYQQHPAFAKQGANYRYHTLTKEKALTYEKISDFKHTGTRELTAEDYIYQIKRMANPNLHCPISSVLRKQIIGFNKLYTELSGIKTESIALENFSMEGVQQINKYQFKIQIKGKDPQFIYWLAMPFFSPIPWEADKFYQQEGLSAHNINLNWYPIGTGPYYLDENDPNRIMILKKNENYRTEVYPSEGEPSDVNNGFLLAAGTKLPMIDSVIYSLEKESIPRWSKFLQGYYDKSGISSDNFDQAIHLGSSGQHLAAEFVDKGISLQTSVGTTTFYWAFNMQDSIIGGYSESARLIRKAIALAIDFDEYISIFLNGRGVKAASPIPPGIFGYSAHQAHSSTSKQITKAKDLLAEAGYPHGVNLKTGQQLIINYDVVARGGPDDKARLAWMVKQFKKINIDLNVRSTQYNRFRDKIRTGQAQFFGWGWNADYPDPENFLFLLYGPNSKVFSGGENASNYQNKEFDNLFVQMKDMESGPARKKIIDKMIKIANQDQPWIWGFHPTNYVLSHQWNSKIKPNQMANNTIKYLSIDPVQRESLRQTWNAPILWPIYFIILVVIVLSIPIAVSYYNKEKVPRIKRIEIRGTHV